MCNKEKNPSMCLDWWRGEGLVCDCWVSRSGMTNDGEDHTENYWHNYQDDLTNRCYLMTEPWRPHAAWLRTRRELLLFSNVNFNSILIQVYAQRALMFFFFFSGCALRMIVRSCSQVMAALAHFFRAMEASDAFTSATHSIASPCSLGVFHSAGTRYERAAKSATYAITKATFSYVRGCLFFFKLNKKALKETLCCSAIGKVKFQL